MMADPFLNNTWKFVALFAGDIKLITVDLFVGAHQFILHEFTYEPGLHVYSIFSIKQLENFSLFICLYLRLLICCQKVALGGKSCSKLLPAQEVSQNCKGLHTREVLLLEHAPRSFCTCQYTRGSIFSSLLNLPRDLVPKY